MDRQRPSARILLCHGDEERGLADVRCFHELLGLAGAVAMGCDAAGVGWGGGTVAVLLFGLLFLLVAV